MTISRTSGQDHSDDQPGNPKKHYLTFQVSYRGTAHEATHEHLRKTEGTVEVNSRFSGRIEVRPTEAPDLPRSPEAQLRQAAEIQAAVMAGDVDRLKQLTPKSLLTWYPVGDQVEITGTISETYTWSESRPETGESRAVTEHRMQSYRGEKVFPGSFGNAFVKIRAEEKKYDFQFLLMPDMASTMEAVRETIVTDHQEEGNNRHDESENMVPLDMGPGQLALGYSNYQIGGEAKGLPLAGEANELIGHTLIPVAKPEGWKGSWDIFLDVSWQIDITLPPVELVLTAPDYDAWRPEGNIKKPAEVGNSLAVRATLKTKDQGEKFIPRVEHIRFELLDTSREPGICLNWPLAAKDTDYDLRLAAEGRGTLSKNDQRLEFPDPSRNDEGQFYADAKIDSYDFGGRASLRVTCLLADGREIEGTLNGEEMPRLPKMKKAGWIADSWRQANDVLNLPDNDDNEEVKGQKHNGDGFTLYEEYRGFAENGRHISADPKKKDLFILNLADVSTRNGIALFERLSQIKAHARLKDDKEMARMERLMNGNHRDAPHRVDQHGVILTHIGMGKGGDTIGVEAADNGKSFRPRWVSRIFIEEPDAARGLFAAYELKYYNLDHLNKKRLYAAAVAHEILHSVGVDHHGEHLMRITWAYFQGPSDPTNPTHKMRFTESWSPGSWFFKNDPKRTWDSTDRGATYTLFWEDNKENLINERAAPFAAALAAARADYAREAYAGETIRELGARFGKSAEYLQEYLAHDAAADKFDFLMFVGQYQGTDSGDESCVMRYYFATAYEAKGNKNTFYVMRPGTKQVATGICKSPDGTGGNAPSHDPQSRFGPAYSGRGNCFEEICPNDDIPPRSIALQ